MNGASSCCSAQGGINHCSLKPGSALRYWSLLWQVVSLYEGQCCRTGFGPFRCLHLCPSGGEDSFAPLLLSSFKGQLTRFQWTWGHAETNLTYCVQNWSELDQAKMFDQVVGGCGSASYHRYPPTEHCLFICMEAKTHVWPLQRVVLCGTSTRRRVVSHTVSFKRSVMRPWAVGRKTVSSCLANLKTWTPTTSHQDYDNDALRVSLFGILDGFGTLTTAGETGLSRQVTTYSTQRVLHTLTHIYIYVYIYIEKIYAVVFNFGVLFWVQKPSRFAPFWTQRLTNNFGFSTVRNNISERNGAQRTHPCDDPRCVQRWSTYVAQRRHTILERNWAPQFWTQAPAPPSPLFSSPPVPQNPIFS